MSDKMQTSSGGICFVGLLAILFFIGLKLTGYITWSWAWVLSPIWISAIWVALIVIATVVFVFRQK